MKCALVAEVEIETENEIEMENVKFESRDSNEIKLNKPFCGGSRCSSGRSCNEHELTYNRSQLRATDCQTPQANVVPAPCSTHCLDSLTLLQMNNSCGAVSINIQTFVQLIACGCCCCMCEITERCVLANKFVA